MSEEEMLTTYSDSQADKTLFFGHSLLDYILLCFTILVCFILFILSIVIVLLFRI